MLSLLSTEDLLSPGYLLYFWLLLLSFLPFFRLNPPLECSCPCRSAFLSALALHVYFPQTNVFILMTTHHLQMSPTIKVFSLNFSLHFEIHLVILKAVKLQLKLQLPWETTIPYPFHLFNTCILFFLLSVTSSLFTFLLELWHFHSQMHEFNHWVLSI